MTELLILAVAVLAFCGVCVAFTLKAYRRAEAAEDFAHRALNITNEAIQSQGEETRALRNALNALSQIVKNLNDEDRAIRDEVEKVRNLIPEDVKEERLRRDVLMSQLNDELETRVRAEQEWNAMVAGVLGYDLNKAKAAGVKIDE